MRCKFCKRPFGSAMELAAHVRTDHALRIARQYQAIQKMQAEGAGLTEIMNKLNVSSGTVYRAARKAQGVTGKVRRAKRGTSARMGSQFLEMSDQGMKPKEIASKLRVSEALVGKTLRKMRNGHSAPLNGHVVEPNSMEVQFATQEQIIKEHVAEIFGYLKRACEERAIGLGLPYTLFAVRVAELFRTETRRQVLGVHGQVPDLQGTPARRTPVRASALAVDDGSRRHAA